MEKKREKVEWGRRIKGFWVWEEGGVGKRRSMSSEMKKKLKPFEEKKGKWVWMKALG